MNYQNEEQVTFEDLIAFRQCPVPAAVLGIINISVIAVLLLMVM